VSIIQEGDMNLQTPRQRRSLLLFLFFFQMFFPLSIAKLRFPLQKLFADATTTTCSPTSDPNFDNIASDICNNGIKKNFHILRLPKGIQLALDQTKDRVGSILLYQPPVGIVAVLTISRLISSGRLFRLYQAPGNSEQALVSKASRLDYHTGRALDLDLDDERYQKFGGVERVRRRLALRALMSIAEKEETKGMRPNVLAQQLIVISLIQVLNVQFPPGGSHGSHQKLVDAFAQVEQAMIPENGKKRKIHSEVDKLMEIAYQTAETRTLDAMLRLARDRLLRSAFRLSRTVKHWKRRVHNQSLLSPVLRDLINDSMENDRMRLAFAEAAYSQEIIRLGKVVGLLMERPIGMAESHLPLAVEQTLQMKDESIQSSWFPNFSNFAFRLNADERGKIQFQHYEESITIGGRAAQSVLLENYNEVQVPWMEQAEAWTIKARSMLYDLLAEALKSSIQPTAPAEKQLAELNQSWRTREYTEPSEITKQWNTIFSMLKEIHKVRRVGEGKSLKLRDNSIVHFFQQWNLLGIPSTIAKILLAQMVHKRLFLPYWPIGRKAIQEFYDISIEIVQSRFWLPIKDLMTELMFRPKSTLLTGISLQDEETSLDYMLRDLKFGDGTPETRQEAMLKATRQYEDDMKSGLMWHAIGGRLIRLILIQVQQLKVGMLNSVETIDVLLQTNRINIQLLAIIPAFVIVTVGTKVFFRFLFTVRVKDLRPMKSVHAEMKEYLDELESILLLADSHTQDLPAMQAMNDQELGNFVLSLYDYLVLLDYSSPQPFPKRQCDIIHKAITGFLGPEGTLTRLNLDDQVRLIDRVKRKHNDLEKYL
jgi:nuclear-control-of-ATPase protein 2